MNLNSLLLTANTQGAAFNTPWWTVLPTSMI